MAGDRVVEASQKAVSPVISDQRGCPEQRAKDRPTLWAAMSGPRPYLLVRELPHSLFQFVISRVTKTDYVRNSKLRSAQGR